MSTTCQYTHELVVCTDWHEWFKELAGKLPHGGGDIDEGLEELKTASAAAALGAFVDSHNAGYCVNSYTTKLNPTLDGVLSKLMGAVRQLNSDWEEEARV